MNAFRKSFTLYPVITQVRTMEQQLNPGLMGANDIGMSLHKLVTHLMDQVSETAVMNKTHLLNQVSRNIYMITDEAAIVPVIDQLLTTVVTNARNSRIHISADRFGDTLTLNIQDQNNNNGYALDFSIMSIEPQASQAGGCISIDGKQRKIATISFSFPNYAGAA